MNRVRTREGRWIRVRMGIICGVLAFAAGLVVAAGHSIMVRDGSEWRELADRQRQRRLRLSPKRGSLYDRNGSPLAISIDVPSVSLDGIELLRGVSPPEIPVVARSAAERIAAALGLEAADVEKKILRRKRFAWLKRRISIDEADKLRDLSSETSEGAAAVRGLSVEAEGHRYYPQRALGGSLLGFVSPDGAGKDGLELSLDTDLSGHRELLRGLRDRSGRLLFMDGIQDEQMLAGHDVYLTIDQGVQNIAERELARAAQTFEALGGSVIVVDPKTGEILALANWPGYNPNDYRFSEPAMRRMRAVTDRFEPGSTAKIFTLAIGLDSGVVKPNERMFCENGSIAIDDVVIRDTHPSGWLSLTQVLATSSNICAAKVGLEMGGTRLYEGLRRFGFGQETGVPVPGEVAGVLRPRGRPWVNVETASAAFGQGIAVTNLQLVMATAAIANGGRLMEPVLVRRVNGAGGDLVREAAPRVRRQVVSAGVARTVAEMMIAVTEGHGTGVQAAVDGFSVAGKTGTAQKAARGGYSLDNHTASFVGFVPAREPVLAIAVTLDEPALDHQGGSVAAPVFRRVAEASLNYLGVTPRRSGPSADVRQLVGASDPARAAYEVIRRARGKKPPVQEVRESTPLARGLVRVPDLTGLPVREALRKGAALGLEPRVMGTGLLAHQEPQPGAVIEKGEALVMVFEPAT
jgi:cell division protein FtsI (penicillin-binding protein 3)